MDKDTTIDSTPVSCVHEIYVLQHVRGFVIRRERYSMKKEDVGVSEIRRIDFFE